MSTPLLPATGRATLPRRLPDDLPAVALDDSAVRLMTDFSAEHPFTITEDRGIDEALADMLRFGVRALLVSREEHIAGLITSYDIQGERPLQLLQHSTHRRHADLRVADVMTPWDDLLALDWHMLQETTASAILELFQRLHHYSHLVVIERVPAGNLLVRGLMSRTRVCRQLRR